MEIPVNVSKKTLIETYIKHNKQNINRVITKIERNEHIGFGTLEVVNVFVEYNGGAIYFVGDYGEEFDKDGNLLFT